MVLPTVGVVLHLTISIDNSLQIVDWLVLSMIIEFLKLTININHYILQHNFQVFSHILFSWCNEFEK